MLIKQEALWVDYSPSSAKSILPFPLEWTDVPDEIDDDFVDGTW